MNLEVLSQKRMALLEELQQAEKRLQDFAEEPEVRSIIAQRQALEQERKNVQEQIQEDGAAEIDCQQIISQMEEMIPPFEALISGKLQKSNKVKRVARLIKRFQKYAKDIRDFTGITIFPAIGTTEWAWRNHSTLHEGATRARQAKEKMQKICGEIAAEQRAKTEKISSLNGQIQALSQTYRAQKQFLEEVLSGLQTQLQALNRQIRDLQPNRPFVLRPEPLTIHPVHRRRESSFACNEGETFLGTAEIPATWTFMAVSSENGNGTWTAFDDSATRKLRTFLDNQGYQGIDEKVAYQKLFAIAYEMDTQQRLAITPIMGRKFSGWRRLKLCGGYRMFVFINENDHTIRCFFCARPEYNQVLTR